mmetsp:Transcript_1043/g.1309  ORF Transcript_1043/g.1309 Transcript_1043/m.1309 type:complete len:416 (-) Transcript_1043:114-1361(-)|eukprot:CAMPEP_0194149882 /NCGR_PEP_ID=MMETSP0152-20130528/40390_1 /TAXON_ID=1049557 /ORGANISM="Thalassiothrix antarctica, Strain L6-D1" /LENGTH=415 /DNA_ID=CAMNT_0038852393 /DNA_START=122 /DNA_END=1369 /DNA_ORIENTATION=+
MRIHTSIFLTAAFCGTSSSFKLTNSHHISTLSSKPEKNYSLSALKSSTDTTTCEGKESKLEVSLEPDFAAAYETAQNSLSDIIANKDMLNPLLHFTKEYLAANQCAYKAGNTDLSSADKSVSRILEAIELGMKHGTGKNRYLFGSSHKALRGKPETESGNNYDFYNFGCNFFGPCMDKDNSLVLGRENLKEAFKYIADGENVVFFSNHQSEADPQVVSICMEIAGCKQQAENIVYVAGHKVTTDPLAIPFSMGRNLICIHSKKHINADPDTKSVKQRQNLKAMSSMLSLLKEGGTSLWVAPSGGRDRRDVDTGEVPLAPFDSKTIDMFRLMGNKSKVPTHFFPLSLISYDLCPPPDYIEAGVGEQRNVRFVPIAMNCGAELKSAGGLEGRQEFCEFAMKNCMHGYETLLEQLETK